MKDLFFTTNSCMLCKPIKEKILSGEFPDVEIINEDIEKMLEYRVMSVPAIYSVDKGELIIGQKKVLEYLGGKVGTGS